MTKILVVDDDPTVREVVLSYLRAEQYDVADAADGETALSIIGHERPDLVVLDVMLPGVDGLEVCRRVRASSNLPIIMLTALGAESERVVGLELGRRRLRDQAVQPARARASGRIGVAAGRRSCPAPTWASSPTATS